MENKKIINARTTQVNNISFKSQLEKTIYTTLVGLGFNPQYEPITFELIGGFVPTIPYYDQETPKHKLNRIKSGKDTTIWRKLILKTSKIVGIRYTPDFYFKYNGVNIYIEAKGFENDVFYIKKKLFIRYLSNLQEKSMYFEIYSKKQLLQAIEEIKNYCQEGNKDEEVK